MTLLAPWFLAGLAAIALPLWLHLRREPLRTARPFSSAMLLSEQRSPLRVRRRWRHRLLLALRVLLLLALCLAFAQPLWPRRNPVASGAALQVIVLDTSLSMSAAGRFERAQAEARRLIGALAAKQRALLVTAGDGVAVVESAGSAPSADRAALQAALAGVHAGSARLDFGAAMAGLDNLLSGQRGDIDVHFISDFQSTGLPTRFADLLPRALAERTLHMSLHPVAQGIPQPNWALTDLARAAPGQAASGASEDAASAGAAGAIVATVRGFNTPARTLTVALQINGRELGRVRQRVPAAGEAQFVFAHPLLAVGDNRVQARLLPDAQLRGDALAADNQRVASMRNSAAEPVPLLTAAPGGRAVSYLSTALAASGAGYVADVHALREFDARTLPRYRWIIVDDLGSLDDALAARLGEFVRQGGALFAALGEASASRDRLPVTGSALAGSVGSGPMPLSVGAVDSGSPLLAGLSGWETVSIAHLLRVVTQPSDQVLVAASDAAPLLIERALGSGRILLYTGDLANAGNDLPVQPLFVGLMAQIARSLSGRGELPAQLPVAASLTLGQGGAPAGQLIDPAGHPVLSLEQTHRTVTVRLTQTGFYEIYTPATEALVAVNPDPLESDLAPLSPVVLERWRTALAGTHSAVTAPSAADRTGRAASQLPPERVPLAPLLLGLLALTALVESLLGNRALQTAS